MANPDRAVWLDVLSCLRTTHPDVCRQWFEDLEPLGADNGVFRVRAAQVVHQRYLQKQCAQCFTEALQSVTGRLGAVQFLGPDDEVGRAAPSHTNGHSASSHPPAQSMVEAMPPKINGSSHHKQYLPADYHHDSLVINPDSTFEHFVVGPENRLAHAASQGVAMAPGEAYNPLFIHGGVGLGKTHLLQAICLRIMADNRNAKILYVSCEGFMTQFLDAVQAGQMNDFRHRFRDVDVLVIDDIHFLAKREKTQEEFFHTFNSLYQAGKQIVLSSDAAPHEIPDLEQRLVSRFQSGMVGHVTAPGYETRVQIVKQKAAIRSVEMPEDVACYLAARNCSSIRELEGMISSVQLQSIADKRKIDLDLARLALDGASALPRPEITITSIIDAVVDYYGVKLTDLQSKRRQKSIAHPRQVCMYLARKHTRYSLEEIGGYFGGRDHTTVMHAVKAVEGRRSDEKFAKALAHIEMHFKPPVG